MYVEESSGVTMYSENDPRENGFDGEVVEGIQLEYDELTIHEWQSGTKCPEPCVGIDKNDDSRHCVFRFKADCLAAGYRFLTASFGLDD